LVQLQSDLKTIENAGIQLVAISYDPPEVLKRFSDQSKITFPLLSDPDSKTIDAYHIRNDAAQGKAEGVPNPGTFLVDREGVIRAKLFLDGYRDRHTTEGLLKAAKAVE
jgi:peroxiredoxin Q/BCP